MSDLNSLVGMYVKIRDERTVLKREFEKKDEVLKEGLKRLEVAMLGLMAKSGANSVATDAGTVFRSTRAYTSVADWDSFLSYVKDNELWHMLKKDVAKTAIEAFRVENNDLPPGVNWQEEVTVGVRRA